MKENNKAFGNGIATWPWSAIIVGLFLVLISLVHIPSAWDAMNYFDPPKRFFWALLALMLAIAGRDRDSRLTRTARLLAFGLLGWVVVRSLFKPQPEVELEVLCTWILPILLFILATGMNSTRGGRIVGGCLVLVGLIQAGVMVLQRFGLDPFFYETTAVMGYTPARMVGTIGYQNQAVDFLAISAAGILLVSRSMWLRLAFMISLLLVAGLTANRGGVMAFILTLLVAGVIWVWFREVWGTRKKRMVGAVVALGACGLMGILALIPEMGSRFREILTDFKHSPAVGSRILMARVGGQQFREKPWMGWGAGEYAFQYLDRLGAVLPKEKTHEILRSVVFARETHNDYLQFAVEFGLVGVLLLGAFLAVAMASLAPSFNGRHGGRPPPLEVDAVLGIAFILVYMAVSGLFSFPWQTSMGGPLAGFLLGWMWPRQRESEGAHREAQVGRLGTVLARSARMLLVVLSVILVGWFARDAFLNTAVPDALAGDGPLAAARLLPRYAYRYHALVGAAYAAQGADVQAENELIIAQRGYRDIPLWNNLGHVHSTMHKWDEATQVYEKWVSSGLDHSNALLNLSITYEQTGRLRAAAECLVRKNTLWNNPSPLEIKRLAVLQLQSGAPQQAQDTLHRHCRKWSAADSKTVAEIENLAGGISLVLGDKQKAGEWFRSALDKNPELKSARRNQDALSGNVTPELGSDGLTK